MPGPGPGREQKQDPGAVTARDPVALLRLEPEHRPRPGLDHVRARADLDLSGEDDHVGVLVHLVVAELLTRIQSDQNGPRIVVYYCNMAVREINLNTGANIMLPGNPFRLLQS